jgi:hypothetical protein
MIVAVTIGTGDVWAPPQLVKMIVDDEMNIVNDSKVSWQISGKAHIRYGAAWIRGAWHVLWPLDVRVRKNQDAIIEAGNLKITVELPPEVFLSSASHKVIRAVRELPPPRLEEIAKESVI